MLHYGASSPKRHVMFANTPHVNKLPMGRLLGWKKEMNLSTKPCKSYMKDGRRRFHGTKFLKKTERLGCLWVGGSTFLVYKMFVSPFCCTLSFDVFTCVGEAHGKPMQIDKFSNHGAWVRTFVGTNMAVCSLPNCFVECFRPSSLVKSFHPLNSFPGMPWALTKKHVVQTVKD